MTATATIENTAYRKLAKATDGIVNEARAAGNKRLDARPAAFREACRRNPQLASEAIGPHGPVMPGAQPAAPPKQSPLERLNALAHELAQREATTFLEAYQRVVNSDDGRRLYAEYLATRAAN